ncbi:MAG: ABC transporter permease [Planctomycetales bacterium]|nr:ABC transporter permease [Planctomycetales bacterium]
MRSVKMASLGFSSMIFLGFVLLWQVAVTALRIHPIILPSPLRVLGVAWQERTTLVEGFLATGAAALSGLAISIVLGVAIAILFSQSRLLRTAFYPYVIFLQTVPIVAIAPLLITWFGYGFKTVVLVSCIISLFPIISNVTAGLISVDQNLKDLFQLSGATRLQTLCKLRIPYAISHVILGARISAGLAVIGAIIGEFFVGSGAASYAGLGTVMTGWQNLARTDALLAVVFISTLLGLCMLGIVNAISRLLLWRWTAGSGFENE